MFFFILLLSCVYNVYSSINLIPKVAIITNIDNNIGHIITNSMAKKGYDLILTYAENTNYINKITNDLKLKYSNDIKLIKGDIDNISIVNNIFNCYNIYFSNTHDLDILILNPTIIKKNNYYYNDLFCNIYENIYNNTILCMKKNSQQGGIIISILHKNIFNIFNDYIINYFKHYSEYYNSKCLKSNINSNVIICNYINNINYKNYNDFTGSNNQNFYNMFIYNDLLSIVDFLCSQNGRFINKLSIEINN